MKADARQSTAADPGTRTGPVADPGSTPQDAHAIARNSASRIGLTTLATMVGCMGAAGALGAGLALWLGAPAAAAAAAAIATGFGLVMRQRSAPTARPAAAGTAAGSAAVQAASPIGTARPLFLELSAREWSRARRYGTGAALLLIEIDRHEVLQQRCGVAALDRVVDDMLRLTAPTLRGADVLTRYSPVQMAVFLAQADALGALDVAERIRERSERLEVAAVGFVAGPAAASSTRTRWDAAASTLPPPLPLSLTVSIGVATLRPAHTQLQSLIDDATAALANARAIGGNCVRAAPVDPSPQQDDRPPQGPGAPYGDRRLQP